MKKTGFCRVAMSAAALALIASTSFAVTVTIPNIARVTTDVPIVIPNVDNTPVVAGNIPSTFSYVAVNRQARVYILSANGFVDNDTNPNRLINVVNNAVVNGVVQAAAQVQAAAVGGNALAPTFSQLIAFPDGNGATELATGDSFAGLVGTGPAN